MVWTAGGRALVPVLVPKMDGIMLTTIFVTLIATSVFAYAFAFLSRGQRDQLRVVGGVGVGQRHDAVVELGQHRPQVGVVGRQDVVDQRLRAEQLVQLCAQVTRHADAVAVAEPQPPGPAGRGHLELHLALAGEVLEHRLQVRDQVLVATACVDLDHDGLPRARAARAGGTPQPDKPALFVTVAVPARRVIVVEEAAAGAGTVRRPDRRGS